MYALAIPALSMALFSVYRNKVDKGPPFHPGCLLLGASIYFLPSIMALVGPIVAILPIPPALTVIGVVGGITRLLEMRNPSGEVGRMAGDIPAAAAASLARPRDFAIGAAVAVGAYIAAVELSNMLLSKQA